MSARSQARRDAEEYARAQMFFGEGAGVRRKLIDATVTSKSQKDPVYAQAFAQEYAKQDMGEHALKARRERERVDRTQVVSKNVKGLATGNMQSVSTPILVLVAVGAIAHKTGLDKKLYEEFKVRQLRYRMWKEKRDAIKHGRKIIHLSDYQDHNGKRSTPWQIDREA